MSKPKFAMYWAASCGGCEIAVLNIHEKILDVDANFRCCLLAGGHGCQVQGCGGDGRWRDHPVPVQRRHAQRRERTHRPTAAQEIQDPGCLRFLRLRRLHPRAGQLLSSIKEIVDTAFTTITTDNPDNIRPQTSYAMPEGEHHHPDPQPGPEDPRPGGGCGLLHARLPA